MKLAFQSLGRKASTAYPWPEQDVLPIRGSNGNKEDVYKALKLKAFSVHTIIFAVPRLMTILPSFSA